MRVGKSGKLSAIGLADSGICFPALFICNFVALSRPVRHAGMP